MTIEPYPPQAIRPVALNVRGLATQRHEVQWLVWKAAQVPGNILEIGTHQGATARALAMAFPNRLVYTVDNPDARLAPEQQHEVLRKEQIGHLARGLPNVRLLTPPVTYDNIGLVFIDGDHRYDAVKADTEQALKHARCVVWHDVIEDSAPWLGVYRYLLDSRLPVTRVEGTMLAYIDLPLLADSPLNRPPKKRATFGR